MQTKLLPEKGLRDWQIQIMREGSPRVLMIWDGYKAVPVMKKKSLWKRLRNRHSRKQIDD